MLDLIELLESFNRKERFFLIRQALGNFQMSDHFRRGLGSTIEVEIPADSFTAMDYHLDWLTAALIAFDDGDADKTFDNQKRFIKRTQEDIDLLVAFQARETYHIILVEAKGSTSWKNDQMTSKADRFRQIFGDDDGKKYSNVIPHFCLASPRRPQWLRSNQWPAWMSKDDGSYIWLELDFPEDRREVTCCDAEGKKSKHGQHFRIRKI